MKQKMISTHSNKLRETLADVLGVEKIEFIPTGNGDVIDGAREQWNDGSNTLCIRPGVVVLMTETTYQTNYFVIKALKCLKLLVVNLFVDVGAQDV